MSLIFIEDVLINSAPLGVRRRGFIINCPIISNETHIHLIVYLYS